MENSMRKRRQSFGNVARRVVRIKRQSRYGKPIQAVWKVFSEYSETSTVHGVRYLGERRRHWSERIWWAVTVSVSVFLCVGFIVEAWWKWNSSPVIISFADEATPISSIPFPSITICSDLHIKPSVLNYSEIKEQLSNEDFEDVDLDLQTVQKVYALSHFCTHQPKFLTSYIKYKNYTIDRNILKYLKQVAPSVFESNDTCELAAEQRFDCGKLFSEILTDAGLCYTFNQMSSSELYRADLLADDFPTVEKFEVSSWHLVDFSINGSKELRNISYP